MSQISARVRGAEKGGLRDWGKFTGGNFEDRKQRLVGASREHCQGSVLTVAYGNAGDY